MSLYSPTFANSERMSRTEVADLLAVLRGKPPAEGVGLVNARSVLCKPVDAREVAAPNKAEAL